MRRRLVTGLRFEAVLVDPPDMWQVFEVDVKSKGIVNLRN